MMVGGLGYGNSPVSTIPGVTGSRITSRLVPAGVWPFVAIAAFLITLQVGDAWEAGSWAGLGPMSLAILGFDALLPVAVLVGCRGDWRSAPVVLAGAAVWTGLVAAAGVLFGLEEWLAPGTWLDRPLGSAIGTGRELAAIVALTGPVVVAYGLSKRRRTETTWPRPLVTVAIFLALGMGLYEAQAGFNFYATIESGYGGAAQPSLGDLGNVILNTARPVELLGLGAMAWSSLSAVRAGEPPRRFWTLICAGSAALFFFRAYTAALDAAMSVGLIPVDLTTGAVMPVYGVLNWGYLAAFAALLVGFGLGLPPDPLDLGDVVAARPA